MTTPPPESDPVRLSDPASGADPNVRRALASARADEPDPAAIAALANKLGPLLGPGGAPPAGPSGPSGPVPPPAGAAGLGGGALGASAGVVAAVVVASGTVAVGLVVVIGLAVALAWPSAGPAPAPTSPPTPIVVPTDPPAKPLPTTPAPTDPPAEPPAPPSNVHASPTPADPPVEPHVDPPPASDLDAELALIGDAQQRLAADPAAALDLAEQHRRSFPDGVMAQEREVVAIEALVALGRLEEAHERGRAFADRWPGSAHLRRVRELTGD